MKAAEPNAIMMVTEAEYGGGSLKLALIKYLPTFTYYMEILESYLIEYKQILAFFKSQIGVLQFSILFLF